MTARSSAVCALIGAGAVVLAYSLFGPILAGMVALATLYCSVPGAPISSAGRLPPGTTVDPREVRQYRVDHPGTSISDAAVAVAHRE